MDLSLVPIQSILDELDKRFETVVVLSVKIRGEAEIFDFHHCGGQMTAIGLCESFAFSLKDQKEVENTDGFHQD